MWEALSSFQSTISAQSKPVKQLALVGVVAFVLLMASPVGIEAHDVNFDLASLNFTDNNGTAIDIGSFDPDTTSYAASVDSTVERVTVDFTTTHDDWPYSSFFVFLSPSDASPSDDGHQVDLNYGTNLLMITVDTDAEAGDALKKYGVEITRSGTALANSANSVGIYGGYTGQYVGGAREGSTFPFVLTRTGDTSQGLTVQIGISEIDGPIWRPSDSEETFDVEFAPGDASARHDVKTTSDSIAIGTFFLYARVLSGDGYGVLPRAPGQRYPALWGVTDDDYGKLNLADIVVVDQDGLTVDIGTFDPDVKSYTGTVNSTVEYVTVTVTKPGGEGMITSALPSDGKPDIDGDQIVLSHGTNEVVIAGLSDTWGRAGINTYSLKITREGTAAPNSEVFVGAHGVDRATEGDSIPFLLTRTGDTTEALTVQVEVTENGGDMVPSDSKGQSEVEFAAGHATARLDIPTNSDEDWEEHSKVELTLEDSSSYQVGSDNGSASTTVRDNDIPTLTASLSVDSIQAEEGDEITATLTVSTDGAKESHNYAGTIKILTNPGTAGEEDFELRGVNGASIGVNQSWLKPVESDGVVTSYQGRYTAKILITDDEIPEADETFDVYLEILSHSDDALTLDEDNDSHTITITGAGTTGQANNLATGSPTISGTAQVGETLTADVSGIADADGLTNVSYGYQWVANDGTSDTDITGATGSSYTLVASDEGKTIKVRVSFTDDTGNDESLTSTATTAVEAAEPQEPPARPRNLEAVVNDDGTVTLTWDDPGDDSITGYLILRRNRDTSAPGVFEVHVEDTGSTATSYVDRDVTPETRYNYRVKARNESGLSRRSNFVKADTPSAPNSPAIGAPAIGGTAQVGDTLTADTAGIADQDGLTNVSYSYQWIADDGTSDSDIAGATDSTYTLVSADEGKTIAVRVSFTDDAGYDESLTSTATTAVEAKPNSPATGSPTITGTTQVGETLTADTSGIADTDGLTNVSYGYQWLADDVEVQGATEPAYTLADADEGKPVKLRVSFTDDAGYDESLTSSATAAVEAKPNNPATGSPTITGTAQVEETLTADTSGIADADGLTNVSYGYQWLADNVEVQGATQPAYTLVSPDEGKTIKVRVSFTDDAGNAESLTSLATAAVEAEPVLQEPPAKPAGLTGTVAYDAVSLTWDDPDDPSITGYQILRRNRVVDAPGQFQVHVDDTGSSATSYVDRDVTPETRYVYRIKARNAGGLGGRSGNFNADTPPAPNHPATGAPTISGTARVGETLTADTTGIEDADGIGNANFSYQWVATDGGADLEIQGATGATYTLIDIDAGLRFIVRVSFSDDAGNGETLTSEVTEVVADAEQ